MPNTWLVAREIIKRDGLGTRGLAKGFHATVLRNAMFNAVYFGSYYNMKHFLIPPEKQDSIPLRLCLGFTAGALSSLGNLPVDVAKSRIQASHSPKYTRTFPTILTVWREEGFLALYKGLLPKIIRFGPGGAIMFVVYEQASNYLETEWGL
jgi:solute carrier family 25 2-oxodicarboxylate transporter 21